MKDLSYICSTRDKVKMVYAASEVHAAFYFECQLRDEPDPEGVQVRLMPSGRLWRVVHELSGQYWIVKSSTLLRS